ncbi:MAG: hypothetical protein J6D47_18680 [Peptostreptococcaceae bacterium]|nr:hypothetical protein [Peptostreptococcaceae bacterium]
MAKKLISEVLKNKGQLTITTAQLGKDDFERMETLRVLEENRIFARFVKKGEWVLYK